MKEPKLLPIDRVAVAEIDAKDRLRPVSEAAVESLIESITDLGVMKDAIHVRQITTRQKGVKLVLIAGAHRLEAAKQLGWDTIPAKVWTDVSDDWARLMEVDDNLAGAELNPLDTALFLASRKRLYEKLYPEAKAATGADLVAKRWHTADTMSAVSFAAATAEKFGISERHVRRLVAAGEALGVDGPRLHAAKVQLTLKDLLDISTIKDVTERYDVMDALREGRAKKVSEARKAFAAKVGAPVAVKDPVEEAFKALVAAWNRAPAVAKRRFVVEMAEEMVAASYDEGQAA